MITLPQRVVAVADAFDRADLPWALGGARAHAYATEDPRATRDIDVNVFVSAARASEVLCALPEGVRYDDGDLATVRRTEQVRVWWDDTPIDLFFSADPFHAETAKRSLTVPFEGRSIRVLCPEDLAVFKAMFDRRKDWVDIESMVEWNAIDLDVAAARLATLLGDDDRVQRLRTLGS
jgi:hypothetical protein